MSVQSIGSGMSDVELMNKYNLSARGLDRLLRRLVKRGDMVQSELDERKKSFYWAEVAFVKSNGRSVEPLDDTRFRRYAGGVGLRGIPGGAQGGHFRVPGSRRRDARNRDSYLVSVAGVERTTRNGLWHRRCLGQPEGGIRRGLDVATDQVIAALESIARNEPMPKDTNPDAKSPEYAEVSR
jgi:hypothetical protein